MPKHIALVALCVGCTSAEGVDLTRAPLVISDQFSPGQVSLIQDGIAEWVTATGGRFCPGAECRPTIGRVEPEDPWSIAEVEPDWPHLEQYEDDEERASGQHIAVLTDNETGVLYDAIVLVRGRWLHRTVLHELGHRWLDHGDAPIMVLGDNREPDCLSDADLAAFCERVGCDGFEVEPSCPKLP